MHSVVDQHIIGESPAIVRVRAMVSQVGATTLPVLIQGPTGSGKELVAEALHATSRLSGQFVAFNSCAIPDSMFEDALFGHVRGAFTGAATDAPGYLTEAHRGTVFFDEIGDLQLNLQAKLLRVLETRRFRPVGARADRTSDFRVITATNRQLSELVAEGRFRNDLAHRLSVVIIDVPSLAERLADLPLLARRFVNSSTPPGAEVELTPAALNALRQYHWPGNVRELRNVICRALALCRDGVLGASEINAAMPVCHESHVVNGSVSRVKHRQHLLDLLDRFEGDTAQVADHLSVHRGTVYRRMERFGIETPKRLATREP